MSIFKKISSCSICGLGLILVFLLIFIIAAPRLINLDSVKARILTSVSQKVGGELKYQKVDLVFLPRPHAVIHQASLSLPKNIRATVVSLKAYPAILPLLKGSVQLAKIKGAEPELIIELPEYNRQSNYQLKKFSFEAIKATLSDLLSNSPLYMPNLIILLKKGRLKLSHKGQVAFTFRNIDTLIRCRNQTIKIVFSSKSNLWEHINFEGQTTLTGFITSGQIVLTHFRPHILTKYLIPDTSVRVTDSRLDLNLSFETTKQLEIFAELNGSMPYLKLENKNEELVFRGKVFKAALNVGSDKTTLSLPELTLDYPRLRMTGKLLIDQKTPHFRIDLRGREVNVESARKACLWLSASASVHEVFSILKGGTISLITARAQARSLNKLQRMENIHIAGKIHNGKIFIPGAHLNFGDVQGNVIISEGVLKGKDLQARLGNSYGWDGILNLGLRGEDPLFRLEMMTHTDIAQLAPVFRQLVKNEAFRKEIKRLTPFKGSAEAKLILGESLGSINVKALVSKANLLADQSRLPYPLKIKGGQVSLNETQLAVKITDAAMGQSYFSRFSAEVEWAKKPHLKISTNVSRIFLKEIYPWLLTLKKGEGVFEDFNVLAGSISLLELKIEGPAFNIKKWRFQTTGKVENLHIESPFFSDPIYVADGNFDARQSNSRKTTKTDILVMPIRLNWGDSNLDIEGNVTFASGSIQLNIDIVAGRIDWNKVKEIDNLSNFKKQTNRLKKQRSLPLRGIIKVSADYFQYGNFIWQPVYANVYFESERTFIDVIQANICGIAVRGALKASPREIELYFYPVSNNQKVAETFSCFGGTEELITGTLDLTGSLEAKAKREAIVESVRGNLKLIVRSGRIYRFGTLAKIFALINLSEIFRGKLPDIVKQGFAYNTIEVNGNLSGNKFRLKEFLLDGASMEVAAQGDIDLITQQIDLMILVAPFKTVDLIVKNTPLLGHILGGHIISIPFKVTGSLKNPEVIPIPPTAVGSGLVGISKRTLQLPIQIMQPLMDGEKEKMSDW